MRSKRPTRAQKIIIKRWHLNPENWRVVNALPNELILEHKHTSTLKAIPEGSNGKQEELEAI
jgi:hypothetical protein